MDSRKIRVFLGVFLLLFFTPLTASVSQVDVLVVADGHRLGEDARLGYEEGMFEDLYNESFGAVKGVEVDFYETNRTVDGEQFGPSAEKMSNYDAVVWYTLADYGQLAQGDGWRTLYNEDINNITQYLENGGSLYLNGHLIHIDLAREDFYTDYLQVEHREGSSPSYWRFKGDNLQQGLNYEWFFTLVYNDYTEPYDDYADSKDQMDEFVNPDVEGIEKKGEGHFEGPISWHTSDYGQKPDYLYDNYFSWKASGLIYIPEGGEYEFGIDSDDAADILINGEKVVGWYDDHAIAGDYDSHTGDKTLSQGLHEFTVRMQEYDGDDGVSVGWKKPGDGSFTTVPGDHFYRRPSWRYDRIEARSYDEGEMVYNQDGDLKISSSGGSIVSGQGMSLGLNTSIEPAESFGVISDFCHHEEDKTGIEGERRCRTAGDALAWQNDIQVSGGSESVVHLEDQKRGDFWLDSDVTFDYTSSGGSDSVLLLGLTLDSIQSNREIQEVTYGGERMTQIHSVEGSDGSRRTQTFYLKNPPQGDHSIKIGKEGGSPDVLVNVLTFDNVNETNPIGDTSKGSEENSVETTVSSENGDLVIDFMGSGGGGFEEGDRQRELFENWENTNEYYQQGSVHAGADRVSMSWEGGGTHTAHSVINLNAAGGKGKYYVETDGDSPSEYDHPDEVASGLVEGLQQNYRTVHTTFGLEAVKSQSSRRKLARNILGFLTGPLTKDTEVSSGEDIPYTSVDESKYTNDSFNLTSTVFYRQERNDTIVNARYMVSNTSTGLNPVLQDGFEDADRTSDLWDRSEEEYSKIKSECGASKGNQAYALRSGDGTPELRSKTFNLENAADLELEFWLKIPSSESDCDEPDAYQEDGEKLYVDYYDGNSWNNDIRNFRADREQADGDWEKITVDVSESYLDGDFRFRFRKGESTAIDTYLIDEVELDREISTLEGGGFYDDRNYTVRVENVEATAVEADIDTIDTGINVTYAVQFKDGTAQGYWGLKGKDWLKVDTVAPVSPEIEFTRGYVNDEIVEVEVKHGTFSTSKMPNMTRFSCDGNQWSRWYERDVSGDQFLEINITSSKMNCGIGSGSRTVYAQFRDYAGNIAPDQSQDSIVYDTQKPEFEGIGPENDTAVNLVEEFIINASDSFGVLTVEKTVATGEGERTYENVYNDGEGNSSLTVNETGGLDPFDREDSGNSSLISYVFDKALNMRKNYFEYDVDTEAPSIQSIEAGGDILSNNSALRPSEDIQFTLRDRNFDEAVLDGGGGNQTFSSTSFEFDAAVWSQGYKILEFWAKDTAGNVDHRIFNYTVDSESPSLDALSHENQSYILNTTSVAFNFSDNLSGVSGFGLSEGVSRTSDFSGWDISVEPDDDSEGVKEFNFTVSDEAENSLNIRFEYIVDTEAPHVFTPYNNSGSWRGSNTTLNINATDDRNLSTISYCINEVSGSCNLKKSSEPVNNVTVAIGCIQGEECRKSVRFKANDSAGNVNGTFESDRVLIDKKDPQADIQGPGQGSTVGAEVDLETEISDSGVGVEDVNYTVYNASNSSQVFDTGDLNSSRGFDAVWDSRDEISSIETVVFNITAVDGFGNNISLERQFEVDNSKTSVTIRRPYRDYVNESFELVIDARRPGERVISTHNYSIYNSSDGLVYSSSQGAIDSSEHRINVTLTASDIGGDGNYTLNSSASDNETGSANASTWFFLDTDAPEISLDESLNGTWQSGTINVGYTASEDRAPRSLYANYKDSDAASWQEKISLSYGGGQFEFPTDSYCEDSAQNDCFIRLVGTDRAGNVNTSVVEFKVDNTPPNSRILSPSESTWQNSSFDIRRQDTDNVASSLACSYGFGDDPSYVFGECNGNLTVSVPRDCGNEGRDVCEVNIRAANPAGLQSKDARTYSIDYTDPVIQSVSPVEGSYVNESQTFEVNFSDGTSGINSSFWNGSSAHKYELQNGSEFQPNWTESGEKQIRVRLNDTAGNILVEKLGYTFDNDKPEINSYSLLKPEGLDDEVRVYPGEALKFEANVSDNFEVNETLLEMNGTGVTENISLDKVSGSYSQGIWRKEVGSRAETGFYNVTALFVEDEAGNVRELKENLTGFRVVDYGLNLEDSSVLAGYRSSVNLTVDFNKSQGLREFNLTAGGEDGEFELENVSCFYEGSCNVSENSSYWGVSAEGAGSVLNLSLNPSEFQPGEDTNVTLRSEIKGIRKTEELLYRVPNPVISGINCLGGCTVDQFENFTVDVEALNNDTARRSGEARNVSLLLENMGSGESYTRELVGLSSGENVSVEFPNLSISEADEHEVNVTVSEEWTNQYGDWESITVDVRDIEKPEIIDFSVGGERVNVNETLSVEAVLDDNKGVSSAKLTVLNSSGLADNITFERSQDVEEQNTWIAEYGKTSVRGVYNLTELYVSDVNGNYRNISLNETFEVSELEMNASLLDNLTTVEESVRFSVNVSGNSEEVDSIEINATGPDGEDLLETYTDVDERNVLSFSQLSNSGKYSFQVAVNAGSQIEEKTQNLEVKYGNATVRNENGNSTVLVLPEEESPYNLTWAITPQNGDLEEVTMDMQSSDSGVLQPLEGGSKSIGEVKYINGRRTAGYQAGLPSQGRANLTMSVNPGRGGNNSSTLQVRVTSTDVSEPVIRNVAQGQNLLNLGEELSFRVNATDNSIMENVTLKIHHPENGSDVTEVFEMDETSQGIYQQVFQNISEIGSYNYSVTAWDIAGNKDRREGNFTVTDQLDISLEADQEAYVKGEDMEFSLQVRDAGSEEIEDYNVTAELSKNGTNITLAEGTGLTSFTEGIESSDPPARDASPNLLPLDYTLFVEIEKGPITEQVTESVGVTRILQVDNKGHTQFIEPGSNFTVWTNWYEPYGQPIQNAIFTSFAVCDSCPGNSYQRMDQNESTGLYKASFTAPNTTEDINVRLVGSDNRGNSESQVDSNPSDPIPVVTVEIGAQGTEANNTGGGGLPSGGFGGSGGPSMQIERVSPGVQISPDAESVELAVNTNIAAQCVYSTNSIPDSVSFQEASNFTETGGVNHTTILQLGDRSTYSYSVMCASENVNSTTDIIFSTEALETFTFAAPTSLTPGNESVTQFKNSSGRLIVYNDQNTPINVEFSIEADCCNLSVVRGSDEVDSVTIPSGGESSLKVEAYAPLFVEPGTYDGTLMLSTVNDSSSHPFSFQVSPHPAVQNYTDLKRRAELLNSSIGRYRIAGIDTSRMRNAFGNLIDHLKEGNRSIQDNDLEGLKSALREGREDAEAIDTMLKDAAFKKYVLLNWWKWAAAFVIMYVLFFLVVMVGIPYYRIQTELTRINSQLENAIDARKKGEKQYFQRKIDKDTFNKMMTERQNEVLQLRGQKEDLKEELDGFLWKKMTLENYLNAPWKGMQELEKWWAANKRARENLSSSAEEEGEE